MLYVTAIMLLAGAGPAAPAARRAAQPPVVYDVPYRLSSTGHIVVRAKVNGKGPYSFILDTGAPTLIVATDVARQCGVPSAPNTAAAFERVEVEGGPVLRREPGMVIDAFQLSTMNSIGLSETKLAGVLGYTLVSRFRMEIDCTQPHMRWTALAYKPQPVPSLITLTGGKPLKAAGSQAKLEGMAKWASSFLGAPPASKTVLRGLLGIELAEDAGLPRVRAVLPGGAADKAGLRAGDRIVSLQEDGSDPVATPTLAELQRAASRIAAGDRLRLTVERGSHKLLIAARTLKGGL